MTYSIPNPIYEYIRNAHAGDAAGPCAVYRAPAGTYTLHQKSDWPSWETYVIARLDGTRVPVSNLPNTVTSDWKLL